jgi:predicted dehydrogenase
MKILKFAMAGTGFWGRYQLAGWREAGGAECVALYNRTVAKAEALAAEFQVPRVYGSAEEMLDQEQLDFLDVCTDVGTHAHFTALGAARGRHVVCQKPMARNYAEAAGMVAACRQAGVRLFINENWRWQIPIRALAELLHGGAIGPVHRARISMVSGFPVFANQPFLKELEQFILTDMGSHVLDVARFLFGEAARLYCQTQRVHTDIRGEDVATVMLAMQSGATVLVEMGYAGNPLERDRFPETYIFVEGAKGSLELGPDFWLRLTTSQGTHLRRVAPPRYPWANPAYDVVHSSIVACHANLLAALRGETPGETTGEDNLRTVQLVFASYESAASGRAIAVKTPETES